MTRPAVGALSMTLPVTTASASTDAFAALVLRLLLAAEQIAQDVALHDRKARVGILVSAAGAGTCLIANNMISGAAEGGIRTMDRAGRPTGPELVGGEAGGKRLSLTGNLAV